MALSLIVTSLHRLDLTGHLPPPSPPTHQEAKVPLFRFPTQLINNYKHYTPEFWENRREPKMKGNKMSVTKMKKCCDSDYQQATCRVPAISTKLSHWKLWTPREIDILFLWNEYTYTSDNPSNTRYVKVKYVARQTVTWIPYKFWSGGWRRNCIFKPSISWA